MNNEIMRGYSYTGDSPKGWLMSEKLDGARAIWDGYKLHSKNGKILIPPAHITAALPRGVKIEGELWAGRGCLSRVQSALAGGDWGSIEFWAFDLITPDLTAAERDAQLRTFKGLRVITRVVCEGKWHLKHFEDSVKTLGGEGVMLFRAKAKYQPGRTLDVQKVKRADFVEVAVLNWADGGLLLEHAGKTFRVTNGAKKTMVELETVLVAYYGLTDYGIPRHASIVA